MRRILTTAVAVLVMTPMGLAVSSATAAARVPAAPASATASPSATYTVVAGDYLLGIAKKLNVRFSDLLSVNGMTATSLVLPGAVLKVPANQLPPPAPGKAAPAPSPAAPPVVATPPAGSTTYTVKSGDAMLGIAWRYGIKYQVLLQLNAMTLTTMLHPGMTLILPANATLINPPKATTGASQTPAPAPAATPPATIPAPQPTLPLPQADSTGNASLDAVLTYTKAQLGKPYVFNGAGPDAFDCSGLTLMAYAQAGIALPHQSTMQSTMGTAVDWTLEPIKAGDLVFSFSSRNPNVISHVGIAISATQWINAPRSGDVVRVGYLPRGDKIKAVRRFIGA